MLFASSILILEMEKGMITNIAKYVKNIKNKKMKNNNPIYSQILKNERIKNDMTLNDLSTGICSVSYLSKLENGLIKSNDMYYSQLFNRMGINFNEVLSCDFDKKIEEVLKVYFYNDLEGLTKIYNEIKDIDFNPNNDLIKCFYYLKLGYYQKFVKAYQDISNIKETFDYLESCCYVYLSIDYFIQNYNYNRALDYLRHIETLEIDNPYLKYLIIEANILTSAFLGQTTRFVNYYNRFTQSAFTGYPIGKVMEMKMLYNLIFSDEFLDDVLNDMNTIDYNELQHESRFNVLYYIYLIKLKTDDCKVLFDDIYQKGYFVDSRFLGILGYCAHYINKREYYTKLFDIVKDFSFGENDEIHHQFICFLLFYVSNVTNSDIVSYIRNEILPNIPDKNLYLYNEIYIDVYLSFLRSQSHYKEGFNYLIRIISDENICFKRSRNNEEKVILKNKK